MTEQQLIEKAARVLKGVRLGVPGVPTAERRHLTPSEAETFAAAVIEAVRADIAAEALREAAVAAVTEDDGIPWSHDYDRATVSAWLEDRADALTTPSTTTSTEENA